MLETARVVGDLMERLQPTANLHEIIGPQVGQGGVLVGVGVLLLGCHGVWRVKDSTCGV